MRLTCPPTNRLHEFLEGSVDDAEASQISDHIVECPSCDRVLSTLESEQDDVLTTLREGLRTEILLQEPEFNQLRNNIRFSEAAATESTKIDEPLETGKRLRDYRLIKKIGEGGMGTVYQAVHVHLAKHVALKILPADKLGSRQSVSRFRQEMRAVGKVNHPNVVSASDAGTIDGQHFLVMELVQGADLARIINDRGPLRLADACEIVRQAAIGLQHAHDNGLVHRDVKPSNIMLALDGGVKLLDLGLAGLNSSEFESTANVVVTDRLTSVGQVMGTLDYMAPEQITASPNFDGRADIYALGATLFQLLTGRTPCGDRSAGTPERIEAVLHNPPLDIGTLRNDIPAELCALLLKMLAKNPADRPQSALDVAGELVRFTSDADLDALAESARTTLEIPSADVDVTDDVSFVVSRTTQPKDGGNSRRPLTAVALASFFLALVGAIIFYIQTDNGVIRVEVTDPALKVAINDQTITMNEDNKKPLIIRTGEHSLTVREGDSDFEFETDRFQIRRGDKIVFKVERLEGEVVVRRNGERFGVNKLPNDHQEIQGDWQVVSLRQGGVVSLDMDALLTVNGHEYKMTTRRGEYDIVEQAGRIEIDSAKNPKTINFIESKKNGDQLIGVYKLEGDILTISAGEVDEAKRPQTFKWPQGPRIFRMECQRVPRGAGGMDIHTSGAREAALRTASSNNMKHITLAVLDHHKAKQQWPNKLEDILPFLEVGKMVFENPLTGDNPGYEYVKPPAPLEEINAAETIVLHQLRDGQRDRQLACAYLDGQVFLHNHAEAPMPPINSSTDIPTSDQRDGQDPLALAKRLGEQQDWVAATDAYLTAYRSDPNLLNSSTANKHVQAFRKAGRLTELAAFFNETVLRKLDSHNNAMESLVLALIQEKKTQHVGYHLLERVFQCKHYTARLLMQKYDDRRFWKELPNPVFYLRTVFLPKNFEQSGWGPVCVQSSNEDEGYVGGLLILARPLYQNREALQEFASEIRELLQRHEQWVGGAALLAFIEAESGNCDEAAAILTEHFLSPDSNEIPPTAGWLLGECLAGKDKDLDLVVIKLLEPCVQKIASKQYDRVEGTTGPMGNESLRVSPIKTLAKLYATHDRRREARELLYGLIDETHQHPLVDGYVIEQERPCFPAENRCNVCHQAERGFYDFITMSDAMTDIGYPVDSFLALARLDASFRNVFSSPSSWLQSDSKAVRRFNDVDLTSDKYSFQELFTDQLARAQKGVTPPRIIEALELGTFQRVSSFHNRTNGMADLKEMEPLDADGDATANEMPELIPTHQGGPDHPEVVLNLMLSVRGDGPDAQATVFSPVIDILKLTVETAGTNAAKDTAELDAQLVTLSEQHPESIEAGIVATVFAFLRNDLDSAKDRLRRLSTITDYPASDGAAFWLVARQALQHEQTKLIGAVLAERALTAAETQPDSGLKEAIQRERSSNHAKRIIPGHSSDASSSRVDEWTKYRIVYTTQRGTSSGIDVIQSDESGQDQLTHERLDMLPRWSPDGKQIAFLSLRLQDLELASVHDISGHFFLYVMDADGKNQRRVTTTPIGSHFEWSPDGKRFLFQSSWEDTSHRGKDGLHSSAIYMMNTDGTQQQQRLRPVGNHDSWPTWSPDGKWIAFCSEQDGNQDIYVMNTDGSKVHRLTDDEAGDTGPVWSPDGSQIAFTSFRTHPGGSVCLIQADGSDEKLIYERGSAVGWSPDAQRILLTKNGQLGTIEIGGLHEVWLTKPGSQSLDATFTSDGKNIVYRTRRSDGWKISSASINGEQPQRIAGGLGNITGLSLWPQRPKDNDTVKAAAEGAPPQAQPVITMLEAVTSNNPDLLKSVLSDSQLAEFNDAEPARNDGLNDLKRMMLGFYETTNLDLNAFRYEYRGNDKAGQVVFTYRGKFKDSTDVVKEGGHWKISGPTKGFN